MKTFFKISTNGSLWGPQLKALLQDLCWTWCWCTTLFWMKPFCRNACSEYYLARCTYTCSWMHTFPIGNFITFSTSDECTWSSFRCLLSHCLCLVFPVVGLLSALARTGCWSKSYFSCSSSRLITSGVVAASVACSMLGAVAGWSCCPEELLPCSCSTCPILAFQGPFYCPILAY